MSQKALRELLGGRAIAYFVALAKVSGSVKAGLFLSQACYWQERTSDEEGWWFKEREDWIEETGLSRTEQESARKALRALKVDGHPLLEELRRGVPPRLHFRVDFDVLEALLEALPERQEPRPSNGRKPAIQTAGTPPLEGRETGPSNGGKTTSQPAGNPPNKDSKASESTSESGRRSASRPRDELFEAIVDAWGWNLDDLTDDARGLANRAAKQLRKIGATPEQVRVFPRWWEAAHQGRLSLGKPTNATAHWPDFMAWWRRSRSPVPLGESGSPDSATPREPEQSPEDRIRSRLARARVMAASAWGRSRRHPWEPVVCPDCGADVETFDQAAQHPVHEQLQEAASA